MTLMQLDSFCECDRIVEQNSPEGRAAFRLQRRGCDTFLVDLDIPGVDRIDVEVTVERCLLTVRAPPRRRSPAR
ncbi:hypothetical protein Psed_3444 [Pseudonocardia dioxanivorans CB1190]|uniref:SHSP domain-containing protein n=1 Tax=Pseudonocardia dioxanivorans (strain ATCC 55486 / DSM 44775 / JCM 13855 / CB1190) TaxID=675635 RepID=F4CZA1_PSEUX|nr:Hsp20/alpha crystallin family protein [Pseudonocardia dioxanivorans]AEA25632.1 hypothetical protein Psed_3444 [Pseudonocardia dioxanivorans CB1190]